MKRNFELELFDRHHHDEDLTVDKLQDLEFFKTRRQRLECYPTSTSQLEAEKWREDQSLSSSDKERTSSESEEELKDLDFEIKRLELQLGEERRQFSV
jgi:hypothetical protein